MDADYGLDHERSGAGPTAGPEVGRRVRTEGRSCAPRLQEGDGGRRDGPELVEIDLFWHAQDAPAAGRPFLRPPPASPCVVYYKFRVWTQVCPAGSDNIRAGLL